MTVTAGTTAQGWWEDFDLTQIPAKWRWIAPIEGPTYSLMERPGFLRVKIPQRDEGYDLWIGRDAAPRLLSCPQPREEPAVSITVHADRPQHEIHPYLYGHFIEHLGRCIYGGIWAERLYNSRSYAVDLKPHFVVGYGMERRER
jgi:hypothetical protein